MTLKVGNLPTVNQDPYPGLDAWWVNIWDDEKVFARAYGATPDEAYKAAHKIANAINPKEDE